MLFFTVQGGFMFMRLPVSRATTFAAALALSIAVSTTSAAQSGQPAAGATVSGRLYHSVSLKPIAGATVAVREPDCKPESGRTGPTPSPTFPPDPIICWSRPGIRADAGGPLRSGDSRHGRCRRRPRAAPQRGRILARMRRNQFDSYQPTAVSRDRICSSSWGRRSAPR